METRTKRREREENLRKDELVEKEQDFFWKQVDEGLERARNVLVACERSLPVHVARNSLDSLFSSLGGRNTTAGRVFRSVFREEDWTDLCASDSALHDQKMVQRVRLERQKRFFESGLVDGGVEVLTQLLEQLKKKRDEGDDVSLREAQAPPKKAVVGDRVARKKSKTNSSEEDVTVQKERIAPRQKKKDVAQEEPVRIIKESRWEDVLERMKLSVSVVCSLQQLSGTKVGVGQLVPPDPRCAEAARGEALVRDPRRLSVMLAAEPSLPVSAKLGRLSTWWDVCKKAFDVAGVLAFLRSSVEEKKGTLRERFVALGCGGYEQATRYDKLAHTLLEFPLLVFQTELISVKGWMQWLIKGVAIPDYWRQRNVPEKEENDGDVCAVCGTGEHVAELWMCDGCNRWFHDTCCGYQHGTLVKEVELGPGNVQCATAYCDRCLQKKSMKHEQVTQAAHEMRAVGNFLCMPDCPFTLERVAGDGYCIFNVLETFAREECQFEDSSDHFCSVLAEAAWMSLEQTRREKGEDAIESGALDALNKLRRNGRVDRPQRLKNGLWKDIEVEHLLLGFAALFPDVCVYVYRSCNGIVKESGVSYGQGSQTELHVLEWASTQHYDRLRRQK